MDGFEEILIPHIGVAYKMAYHLTGGKEDAEDLVQDAYLKARRSFHTLKDYSKGKSWLLSILYRSFVDEYRKKRRHLSLEEIDAPAEDSHAQEGGGGLEWPERFTSEDISRALGALDPRYRLPLVAHFLSGQSYKEISETLDLPIGTVMSRIHRAKAAMRKELSRLSRPSLKVVKGGRHGM